MRPDEHKKKKNAAYKKKHGISKEAGDEPNAKKGGKSKSDKLKSDDSKHAAKNEPVVVVPNIAGSYKTSAARQEKTRSMDNLSNTSSSDSETDVRSKKKAPKTFRRREIVSNWQKYEVQPDMEEKATARGESYEKLLNASGEAVSHFRFKDELQWEQEAALSQEDISDQYSQLLSINPSQLAQSLACLPVHQVLGIDQNVFTSDQLESMKEAAKENQSLYSPKQSQDLLPEDITYVPDSSQGNLDVNLKQNKNSQLKESDKNSLSQTLKNVKPSKDRPSFSKRDGTADSDVSFKNNEPEADKMTKGSNIKHKADSKDSDNEGICEMPIAEPSLSLQDDDLDFLLNMDSPAQTVIEHNKHSAVNGQSAKPPSSETSPKASVLPSATTSPPSKSTKVDTKEHKNTGNLEDWLDSILDD